MKNNLLEISFVIPVFNEAQCLYFVHNELIKVMNGYSYEIIYVNDGSTDKSEAILNQFYLKNPEIVTIINLYGKNGKATAQKAGISYASGEKIIFMDSDGQDDPNDIKEMLEIMEDKKADMVVGQRHKRDSHLFYKLISSLFNTVIRTISNFPIKDINASLKIVQSSFLKEIPIYAGHYRFLPLIFHNKGLKVIQKKINHRSRFAGISKYTPFKMIEGFWDMLTIMFLLSNNLSPLRFFGGIGILLFAPGTIICIYILSIKIYYGYILNKYPLLLLGILLILTGIQLFCTGLLAELMVYSNAGIQQNSFIKSIKKKVLITGLSK